LHAGEKDEVGDNSFKKTGYNFNLMVDFGDFTGFADLLFGPQLSFGKFEKHSSSQEGTGYEDQSGDLNHAPEISSESL
jgi:hypothetical protein